MAKESKSGIEVIISARFNQDSTCLAISTSHGFRIYSVTQPSGVPILLFKCDSLGVVTLVEMQFRSNICALITRETFHSEVNDPLDSAMSVSQEYGGRVSVQKSRHSVSSGSLSAELGSQGLKR